MSTSIQPLSSIGPADPEKAREEELKKDPAKRDYLEGREQFKKGDHSMAAMSFHNALKAFEEKGDEQGVANASDRLGDVCLEKKILQQPWSIIGGPMPSARKKKTPFPPWP
ncbi:hypothetical protein VU10_04955 [Desulfobulbus sp. US1]|nr:hypothetical protein [Desulfobulbus sp. US2]MCW5209525.1 hypothetical protein [Desulfobulbus sp. US1]